MPVTDDQVATVRALLADDRDRYGRLFAGLVADEHLDDAVWMIPTGSSLR
jgi:hypothetical protein